MITLQIHRNSNCLEPQSRLVKKSKIFDLTDVNTVPDTIPKEKKFYPRRKQWKIIKRHYLQEA